MNRILIAGTLALGALALTPVSSLAQICCGGGKRAQKPQAAGEVRYKAECGMTYSAAEAKKHKYVCPMDKKPLTKVGGPANKDKAGKK